MKAFPVVHVRTPEQAAAQTQIAVDAEADGVFLIHHGSWDGKGADPLVDSFNRITSEHPDLFVGINYLGPGPLGGYKYTQELLDTHAILRAPDALWFDDVTDFADSAEEALGSLRELAIYRQKHPWLQGVTFLGGVSFKYTEWYTDDPEESARLAGEFKGLVDIVTTSGAGTGSAPSPEKIAAMAKATGPGKLAVASGISVENIQDYRKESDMMVLVASSLETEPYSGVFVPHRVHEFVDAAHDIAA